MKKHILFLGALVALILSSCGEEWMTDVVPTNKIDPEEAFNVLSDGRNALNGVYSLMQESDYQGGSFIMYGTLKGIDVRSTDMNSRRIDYYRFVETTENVASNFWVEPYICLASINNGIDNIDKLSTSTASEEEQKKEIKANFYALRALCHFDLLKIYSRIPASLSGDPKNELGVVHADHVISKDEKPMRKNLAESYTFIINDLLEAIKVMPEGAKTPGWFSKDAMKGLLARIYLYNGDNSEAYTMAKEVITAGNYSLIEKGNYATSWGKNSNPEAMLSIINTEEDNAGRGSVGYQWGDQDNAFRITTSFMEIMNENADDDRLSVIVERTDDEYVTNKFPNAYDNDLHLIRLSEMYFIAAEAVFKAEANKTEAANLINLVIEKRTGVENTIAEDDVTLERIVLEKRKEFVGEGHAMFDLVRNKMDIVRTGDDHLIDAPLLIEHDDENKVVLPIPLTELNANENIQQNPTYNR